MKQKKNTTAIVTGGASGIGKATAIALAREGCDLVVTYNENAEGAQKTADEIKALGRKAIAVKADVCNGDEVNDMVKTAIKHFGKIDILVNNAGGPAKVNKNFSELDKEDWDHTINLNLGGVFNCTRAVINHMIGRRSGKIINISSLAGLLGDIGCVDYSAAKAGVIGFTMALAKEVAGYGINVNCISPGPILTRGMQIFPERIKQSEKATGLGRLGKPEEVAALVVFLTSEEAGFITGQNYPICGLKNLGVSI